MRVSILDLPLSLFLTIYLLTLSVCRSAESEGDLDQGVNPHIDEQLYDTMTARRALDTFEQFYVLPRGLLTPVVPYTDEGVDRAVSHIATLGTRFTLIPDPENPGGYLAYSTFAFQHPRSQRWKHTITMISIAPGLKAELLGEAHFPDGMSIPEMRELWDHLNTYANWDRNQITSQLGRLALRF